MPIHFSPELFRWARGTSTESDRLFSPVVLPSMILSQSGTTKPFYDRTISEALGAEPYHWSYLLSSPPALVQYRNLFIRELK